MIRKIKAFIYRIYKFIKTRDKRYLNPRYSTFFLAIDEIMPGAYVQGKDVDQSLYPIDIEGSTPLGEPDWVDFRVTYHYERDDKDE